MSKTRDFIVGLALAGLLSFFAQPVMAGSCTTYGAKATAGTEKSAKWFVMETIVQQVSWGMWPGWVANGKTPGYKVKGEKYKCSNKGGGTTCIGQATFCKIK